MKKLFSIFLILFAFLVSAQADAPDIDGLVYENETSLQYAQGFHLYRYQDGYTLISITDGADFLVIPEGADVPENLGNIIPLQQPLSRIYLAATSAMSLFDAVDAVDCIRLSGAEESSWYIPSAVEAMQAGAMLYAGKYSAPDYELLLSEDCQLAIESTMIYHTPKVKEMLEDLDIPVLVDRSSYEPHPLGRTEWVKLYAALAGKEDAAEACFQQQVDIITQLESTESTGKTVAFFYVNTDGSIVIRKNTDYIPKMIALAGGTYCFDSMDNTGVSTSFPITMEDFYAVASQADVLIYNATIGTPLTRMSELLAKDSLFADFKAVQTGDVYCTGKDFYQKTDIVGQMICDIHLALTGGDEGDMTFLHRVIK